MSGLTVTSHTSLRISAFFPHISFEISREFLRPVGLKEFTAVARKGVAVRLAGLFRNDYTFLSHGEAMSTVVWDAGVKILTSRAFDVSRAALDLRRWHFS